MLCSAQGNISKYHLVPGLMDRMRTDSGDAGSLASPEKSQKITFWCLQSGQPAHQLLLQEAACVVIWLMSTPPLLLSLSPILLSLRPWDLGAESSISWHWFYDLQFSCNHDITTHCFWVISVNGFYLVCGIYRVCQEASQKALWGLHVKSQEPIQE